MPVLFTRTVLFNHSLLILILSLLTTACSASPAFPIIELQLKGKNYQIEVADTPQRKSQGMMFRQSIHPNSGMLFAYETPVNVNIWMKNTLIPLAVIWLDAQAVIMDMKVLYPCSSRNCPSFGPPQASMYVLELHSNELSRFKIGDRLEALQQWKSFR